ncbi:MAG: Na/Pi cotransporter family protein [Mycoplasmatales bacterium]|nr:Na/Pi cotransporter family protein [Mycoplasmatales bacterium]
MQVDNLGLAISLALGGLGLFLLSVKLLSNGLKSVSGEKLRSVLKRFTRTNFHSLIFGIIFTTMIQSSDGAVGLVISLVAAGFMPLKSALAFVLGANIGTATTSIIVSLSSNFSFTQYFMILLFIGGMGYLVVREKSKLNVVMIIASLGMLFLGLKVMGAGMKNISKQDAFSSIVGAVGKNSWLSAITAFTMTGLMQSSSASVTVAQNIYQTSDAMNLIGAIGFVIGANIGTTVTAFLTTIGGNKDTKRVALFWMITNTSLALLILPISTYYADFVRLIVPDQTNLVTGEVHNNFQMSVGHIFFNVFLVVLFFPILNYMVKIVCWIIKEDSEVVFKYEANLPVDLINTSPQLAIEAAANAYLVIGEMNLDAIRSLEKYMNSKNMKYLSRMEKLGIAISETRKSLYDFLAKLNTNELSNLEASRSMKLILASRSQERVSQILEVVEPIIKATYNKRTKKYNLSASAFAEIATLLMLVKKIQKRSVAQSKLYSKKRANEIATVSEEIHNFVEIAVENHEKRLKKGECLNKKIDYSTLMHAFERIARHQARMAKVFRKRKNVRTSMKKSTTERLQAIFEADD